MRIPVVPSVRIDIIHWGPHWSAASRSLALSDAGLVIIPSCGTPLGTLHAFVVSLVSRFASSCHDFYTVGVNCYFHQNLLTSCFVLPVVNWGSQYLAYSLCREASHIFTYCDNPGKACFSITVTANKRPEFVVKSATRNARTCRVKTSRNGSI